MLQTVCPVQGGKEVPMVAVLGLWTSFPWEGTRSLLPELFKSLQSSSIFPKLWECPHGHSCQGHPALEPDLGWPKFSGSLSAQLLQQWMARSFLEQFLSCRVVEKVTREPLSQPSCLRVRVLGFCLGFYVHTSGGISLLPFPCFYV